MPVFPAAACATSSRGATSIQDGRGSRAAATSRRHPARAGTRINHIETARGYGSSEMQLGYILPRLPREKMIVQRKVSPFATAREFRETFENRWLPETEHVDLLSLHGINNAELLDWSLRPAAACDEAAQIQREGRCPLHWLQHARHHRPHPSAIESMGFDYVNLHCTSSTITTGPPCKRPPSATWACSSQPYGQGGLLQSRRPSSSSSAIRYPPSLSTICTASPPQVHTLSVGAARPSIR